jgi:hypothetical protein
MQSDRLVRKAIRSSSEGIILMPSKKAEQVYELPRLNEIAQSLRRPAAVCFLRQAIEHMERTPRDDLGYGGVPAGQVKIRARLAPDGQVLRTEVLESGFVEDAVPTCVAQAIQSKRWPQNKGGNNHHIDIVYWVSLGVQTALAPQAFAAHMRRQEAEVGVKAKECLQGRTAPGEYRVEGLNLVGSDGGTMINRVDHRDLPEVVRTCLATAYRAVRLPRESEAFVRPVSPVVTFVVSERGAVTVGDEEWLRLVQLEERAQREAERTKLTGSDSSTGEGDLGSAPRSRSPGRFIDEGEPSLAEAPVVLSPEDLSEPVEDEDPPAADPAEAPAEDPGRGGIKLDLGSSRRR